jgi:hypothetical protein
MLDIGRAGQRGLERAREHVRYQFLGGPTPSDLAAIFERYREPRAKSDGSRVSEAPPRTRVGEAAPRARVAIDTEAEELELETDPADSEQRR